MLNEMILGRAMLGHSRVNTKAFARWQYAWNRLLRRLHLA